MTKTNRVDIVETEGTLQARIGERVIMWTEYPGPSRWIVAEDANLGDIITSAVTLMDHLEPREVSL